MGVREEERGEREMGERTFREEGEGKKAERGGRRRRRQTDSQTHIHTQRKTETGENSYLCI